MPKTIRFHLNENCDPRIAAGALLEAGTDLVEQLLDDLRGAQEGDRLAPGGEVAAPAQGDHLLGHRLDGLGLRLGRLDPAVLNQRASEIGVQRLAVG